MSLPSALQLIGTILYNIIHFFTYKLHVFLHFTNAETRRHCLEFLLVIATERRISPNSNSKLT